MPEYYDFAEAIKYDSDLGRSACVAMLLHAMWWGLATQTTPDAVEVWIGREDGSYAHFVAYVSGRGPRA